MIGFCSQSGMSKFLGNPVAQSAEKYKVLRKNFRSFLISCFIFNLIFCPVSGSRSYSVTWARAWTKCLFFLCTSKGTLRQVSEAPLSLLAFVGVVIVKQFCRFAIRSNTQCITPVYALPITPSPPPPPPRYTMYRMYLYLFTHGKGGGD
jgi:hypothetical protein